MKDNVLRAIVLTLESGQIPTFPKWATSLTLEDSVLTRVKSTKVSRKLGAQVLQVVVPDHLQLAVIKWAHANFPYSHASAKVTSEWITKAYWFYGLGERVKQYVKSCYCFKLRQLDKRPPALTIPRQHLTEKFNDVVHVDFLGPSRLRKKDIGTSFWRWMVILLGLRGNR